MQHFRNQLNKYKFYNNILYDREQNIREQIDNSVFLLYALKSGQMQPQTQYHYNILSYISAGKQNTQYYDSYTNYTNNDGAERDRMLGQHTIAQRGNLTSIYDIQKTVKEQELKEMQIMVKNDVKQEEIQKQQPQINVEAFIQSELKKYEEDYDCVHIQKILKVDPRQYLKVKDLLLQ